MSDLKHLARHIFTQTLAAIDIPATMQNKLAAGGSRITVNDATFDLADYDRIYAIAIGKASPAMARGLASLIAPFQLTEGVIVAPGDLLISQSPVPGFRAIPAGHPLPDAGSFAATRQILDLLGRCDARSLVFFLLSGGGSSLVELPLDPAVTLQDVRELHRLLVGCGAPIDEINAVRKHLSAVKGGRLAAAAPAAMKLTLGVTDVPEGREPALGSGPTLPDPSTVADACAVIERYDLLSRLPTVLREKFIHPEQIAETLKPGDAAFANNHFQLLLGMHDLFHHAHHASEACGFVTICDNTTDDWPLGKARDYLFDQLEKLAAAHPGRRVAVIADGELSSPVQGKGIGGRNSAFVLDCIAKLAEAEAAGREITVLSAGTDGRDGSSPAAGAVADGGTLSRAQALGVDPRDFASRSDSYSFFHALDDAVETGPTGNNLRDLRILLRE